MCVVIVATLTALAVASLRASRRAGAMRAALVELEAQDSLMRDRARQGGRPGRLVFHLDAGSVTRVETSADGRERVFALPAFADAARVEQVRSAGERFDRGDARITCSAAGRTTSYAVLVAAGGKRQWVVVPGLTVALEAVGDEDQVEEILATLSAGRDDTR